MDLIKYLKIRKSENKPAILLVKFENTNKQPKWKQFQNFEFDDNYFYNFIGDGTKLQYKIANIIDCAENKPEKNSPRKKILKINVSTRKKVKKKISKPDILSLEEILNSRGDYKYKDHNRPELGDPSHYGRSKNEEFIKTIEFMNKLESSKLDVNDKPVIINPNDSPIDYSKIAKNDIPNKMSIPSMINRPTKPSTKKVKSKKPEVKREAAFTDARILSEEEAIIIKYKRRNKT